MKFTPAAGLPGVWVVEPDVRRDARGFFFEAYSARFFKENGIGEVFVQDNHSLSRRGVLRGLHFQVEPHAQAKLVSVLRGSAFDVVVDIRKESGTFGRYATEVLSAENRKTVYIPKGFAHGFLALEDDTHFLYKVSDFYSPAGQRGILWNDPQIGIPWPAIEGGYLLSEKDKKNQTLETYRQS
ncbi:MAG: dTDP-4-dehydrorhamnose 3,5-epimerase [Candidatus Omnitrophica bacterium]|nr:dTDP-4-dehydrorhamnose 3,5-epimerase [Candidatus Omnitrophota bacterium]